MKFRAGYSVLAAALVLALASILGCEDTAKHTTRVRPPASAPQPAQSASGAKSPAATSGDAKPKQLAELPLPAGMSALQALAPPPRSAVDALIDQVQATYAAGQQAYQDGRLADARKDFNIAVNLLMKSGLETTGDTRLQELFNQITDTMQNYELEAEQADEAVAEEGGDAADMSTDEA